MRRNAIDRLGWTIYRATLIDPIKLKLWLRWSVNGAEQISKHFIEFWLHIP